MALLRWGVPSVPPLKQRAPHQVKVLGRRFSVAAGTRTAALRMSPSFVLAGAQRCGTTSLFRALMAHPSVLGPVHHKGVNYFDVNYARGRSWYLGHFPVRSLAHVRTRGTAMTFEASGYYVYHPHAAVRLASDLPDVKVLVMLRDPVERAYSAYKHEFARGFETETFERALELEDERIQPDLDRMLADPHHYGSSHRHHSYRRRGQYAEQLQRVVDALGRDRLHVVDSARFFASPQEEFSRVTDFLGLARPEGIAYDRWNARPGSRMPLAAETFLRESLAPHDQALERLLGERPSWCR